MSNNNETVEQVCESVEYLCGTDGGGLEIFGEHINPISLAERILAAHNREMNALAAQKTAEAHEAFVKNAELADAITEKDAEIVSLRALVKEMADALDNYPCHNCKHGSERCEWCGTIHELDALVARALEVAK